MASENLKITRQQADELAFAFTWDEENFPQLLEKYTGMLAKPVSMFQIFDDGGDYIGDSWNNTTYDMLRKAGIEVVEDA